MQSLINWLKRPATPLDVLIWLVLFPIAYALIMMEFIHG